MAILSNLKWITVPKQPVYPGRPGTPYNPKTDPNNLSKINSLAQKKLTMVKKSQPINGLKIKPVTGSDIVKGVKNNLNKQRGFSVL